MQVTFEDCSEIDPRRVSVFEHIKDRQEIINLRRQLRQRELIVDAEVQRLSQGWARDGYDKHELECERDVWKERYRQEIMKPAVVAGPVSDFKPLTFWRAVGLITLGAAFGASFVLFGLPKAHAQDYRMPGYEAPPPPIQYQPLTPPNSLSQGEPQSFSIIPDAQGQSNGLGQLEGQSGTVINNDTGAVMGTYQVNQ